MVRQLMSKEQLYHQLALQECEAVFKGVGAIQYKRSEGGEVHQKIVLLCGQTGMKPYDLIDLLIDHAFKIYFGGGLDEGPNTYTIQG